MTIKASLKYVAGEWWDSLSTEDKRAIEDKLGTSIRNQLVYFQSTVSAMRAAELTKIANKMGRDDINEMHFIYPRRYRAVQ